VSAISESKIPGLFRVTDQRGQVIFASADGDFFLTGELYSTAGGELVNLSEQERQGERLQQLALLSAEDRITFPAKGEEKAHISVFTDIDCGYCRKLHGEVPRMNELGISVSYLAFPRAGVGSPSYDKLVTVWCSEDRLDAMTQAKAGKVLPKKACENPVAAEYNLGNKLGVTGTPAIVLADGALVPGYIPAEQLAQGLGISM
jgi:thiol:disulfide interchange protein DsbC